MNKTYAALIQQSESDLEAKQKGGVKVVVSQRLQMFRLLKSTRAKTLVEAACLVGVRVPSIQRWWKQYRLNGLESLLVVAATRQPRLSTAQQQTLLEESGKGGFSTIAAIASWVEQSFGFPYTQVGMWKLVSRLQIKKKTARPSHGKKDEQAVAAFKKVSLP